MIKKPFTEKRPLGEFLQYTSGAPQVTVARGGFDENCIAHIKDNYGRV
ncbi:MAG: hypothetical protein HYT28_02705 [Parcubacteria group bacterium]|nr:hypothetical protein [Parcubacteria group bacterium]